MANLTRLPGPNADLWDWQLDGACRGMDSEMFFHPDRERGEAREQREAAALQVCAGCPVRAACLEHALRVNEPYGVWGGATEHQRAAILQERKRSHAAC